MNSRALCLAFGAALAMATVAGCQKSAPLPEQPTDDASTRTTTAFNPPSSPEELAVKCDVPIYPGATAPDGMSRMPKKEIGGGVRYELVLTTKDSPAKVAKFYEGRMNLPATGSKSLTNLIGRSPKGNDIIIEVGSEGGQTIVRIHAIAAASG